jgi:mycothiol synthase
MNGSDLVGSPDIVLVWPPERDAPTPTPVAGYAVQPLAPENDAWWIDIHRQAVPSWDEGRLRPWLDRYRELALPDGILVAVEESTGLPVATAGSLANDKDGMFPDGGQLAWVATVPGHRNQGLGGWLSALATLRLHHDGFRRIFLCTGDDLLPAIRVYLDLGYVPCLYASDQPERWRRICEAIDRPHRPEAWPTPAEYGGG